MTALDVEPTFLVAETFGPTLQGEGPSTGEPAVFIRLSRCNLNCVWCDEPHTWDTTRFRLAEHTVRRSTTELTDWVSLQAPELVVITGGEPLLQQSKLVELVVQLVVAGRRVEIETNGTIVPHPMLCGIDALQFNVSPKLAGSGVPRRRRIVPAALTVFRAKRAVFKFVITAEHRDADLAEADALVKQFGMRRVWLMPEGTSRAVVRAGLGDLADEAIHRGWALSSRLHVELWEHERGR